MKEIERKSETAEVVDIHCHAAGIGAGRSGCHVSRRLINNWRYRLYLKAFGVTEREIHESGDGLVIQRLSEQLTASLFVDSAVLLALDCCVDRDGHENFFRTELYVPNEFVMKETSKHPNLYFGASIHPYRNDAISRLHSVASQGAVLMKWLPSVQHIDPADRRLVRFYESLRELGLPLLIHTGNEHSFTASHDLYSDPARLTIPLDCGVTVIAAHMATNGMNGGEKNFERLLSLCSRYPNLFGDISSLTQLNKIGHLQKVLAHNEILDRLIYGTDMPILNTAAVSPFYFMNSLGLRDMISINHIKNSWDRDIKLKEALGVPQQVFDNGSTILKLNSKRRRQ
jgi:hypothetical protein